MQLKTCELICLHIQTNAKPKRQNQLLGYYKKIFVQFIWLINYDTNSRKSVYGKVIFLIASDWCSPIIVINVFFCIWFLRISSINGSYSLSLKVNWVIVCNIFLITFYIWPGLYLGFGSIFYFLSVPYFGRYKQHLGPDILCNWVVLTIEVQGWSA